MKPIVAAIAKGVAAFVDFLALVIGAYAHFEAQWTQEMKKGEDVVCSATKAATFGSKLLKKAGILPSEVKPVPECPKEAIPMELVFISLTAIVLVVSIVMIIMGLVQGQRKTRYFDIAWCLIAGILLIVAGVLMITSTNAIVRYRMRGQDPEFWEKAKKGAKRVERLPFGLGSFFGGEASDAVPDLEEIEKREKHSTKRTAAALAIIGCIAFFVTGIFSFFAGKKPEQGQGGQGAAGGQAATGGGTRTKGKKKETQDV